MPHPGISRFTAQHWLAAARDHAWRSALAATTHAATLAGLPGHTDTSAQPATDLWDDPSTAPVALSDMDPSVVLALTRRLELDTPPHAHAEVSALVVWIRTELWALHSFDDAERAARTGLLSLDPVELDPAVLLAAALRADTYRDATELAAVVTCRELTLADAHCMRHLARATGCIPALLEAVATGGLPVADAVAAVLAAAEDSRSCTFKPESAQSQSIRASHVQPQAVPAP